MTQSILAYRLVLTWNGTVCMVANCSAVVAYDVVVRHFEGNFAGSVARAHFSQMRDEGLTLDAIMAQADLIPATWRYSDETGSAGATIVKLVERAAITDQLKPLAEAASEFDIAITVIALTTAAGRWRDWSRSLALPEVAASFAAQAEQAEAFANRLRLAGAVTITEG